MLEGHSDAHALITIEKFLGFYHYTAIRNNSDITWRRAERYNS